MQSAGIFCHILLSLDSHKIWEKAETKGGENEHEILAVAIVNSIKADAESLQKIEKKRESIICYATKHRKNCDPFFAGAFQELSESVSKLS